MMDERLHEMMDLGDKITAVTGAASGIGKATANAFADVDGMVYMGDLNVEAGEAAAADIRGGGGKASFIPLDITDDASIAAFHDQIIDEAGRLDVLANVAGWGHTEFFVQSRPADWNKEIDINLMGPMKMCHAFLPGMYEQSYGRIVNVSSDAGRVGSLAETVYAAAKGGQIAFTKALAREGARYKVAVNCICPGPTETPLLADTAENIQEALKKAIPMRRFGQPEEIANAILFFACEQSSYCTGQVLSVSGGLTMVG
jgi:2-hydroxycyclohexanecarboxyl-CoA dehydrogenase